MIIDLHGKPPAPYLYVGRFMGGKNPLEASPLGNPFKVKQHGANCLRLYRRWLFEQIEAGNPQIMFLLTQAITDETVLACWCCDKEGEAIFTEPEICHAQIIAKAWRHLREKANTA